MKVNDQGVTVGVTLNTQNIDATGAQILAGTMRATTMEATTSLTTDTLTATVNINTPSIISDTDEVSVGDQDDFTITRPPQTTGDGSTFTIQGQTELF